MKLWQLHIAVETLRISQLDTFRRTGTQLPVRMMLPRSTWKEAVDYYCHPGMMLRPPSIELFDNIVLVPMGE